MNSSSCRAPWGGGTAAARRNASGPRWRPSGSRRPRPGDRPARCRSATRPFLFFPTASARLTSLEVADRALLLAKQNRRNSHTGLAANAGVGAKAILDFLSAGPDAALPRGVKILRG